MFSQTCEIRNTRCAESRQAVSGWKTGKRSETKYRTRHSKAPIVVVPGQSSQKFGGCAGFDVLTEFEYPNCCSVSVTGGLVWNLRVVSPGAHVTEVNQLVDFEEGSWCNIGVKQQEVTQRCYDFGNKISLQAHCTSARLVSDVRGTNRPRQRSW